MKTSQVSSVPEKARATSCEAVSHGSDGASAPLAAATHPITTESRISRRRPNRSADAISTRASTPPSRTALPETPWAASLALNCSAAKAMDWLKRVLR